jgi:hypothetical protein
VREKGSVAEKARLCGYCSLFEMFQSIDLTSHMAIGNLDKLCSDSFQKTGRSQLIDQALPACQLQPADRTHWPQNVAVRGLARSTPAGTGQRILDAAYRVAGCSSPKSQKKIEGNSLQWFSAASPSMA